MFKKYQLRSYNFRLVILLIVTSVYGIAVINSADSSYTIKQCAGLLLSLFVMVVVSLIDYNWLLRFYWLLALKAREPSDGLILAVFVFSLQN